MTATTPTFDGSLLTEHDSTMLAAAYRPDRLDPSRNPDVFVLVWDKTFPVEEGNVTLQHFVYHCVMLDDGSLVFLDRLQVVYKQDFEQAYKVWFGQDAPLGCMYLSRNQTDRPAIDASTESLVFLDVTTLVRGVVDDKLVFRAEREDVPKVILDQLEVAAARYTYITTHGKSLDDMLLDDGVDAMEQMALAFDLLRSAPRIDGIATKRIPRFLVATLSRTVQNYLSRKAENTHARDKSDVWHIAPQIRDAILAILRAAGYEVSDPYTWRGEIY